MARSSSVLILDNGAHSIKQLCSHSTAHPDPPVVRTYRNTIARSKTARRNYVADELDDECEDFGGLTFRVPMERGILNNWEVEKGVWDRVFGKKGRGLGIIPQSTSLLITEPVLNLPNVQEHHDQIIFEEYEFESYLRAPGPALIPYGPDARPSLSLAEPVPECVLVIDAGHSFTHVVPVLRGAVVASAVRRIDIGGKLLTNYLKEIVSYRHWYMMDQTAVMENCKEKACYVTNRWEEDWEVANKPSNPIVRTYVLPDFTPGSSNKLGYVRTGLTPPPPSPPPPDPNAPWAAAVLQPEKEEEQLLFLANERFTVPEALFTPSTIDLNQSGLSETVASSIATLPEELRGMFWANIVCVGGTVGFEGFGQRLRTEIRSFAPPEYEVNVKISSSPTHSIALSAHSALSHPAPLSFTHPTPLSSPEAFVTKQEYQEGGSNACRRKFERFVWKSGKEVEGELGSG
ncbi:hypothetical protein JCM8547_001470 [Rhodosporidiobolus lusitaniae]